MFHPKHVLIKYELQKLQKLVHQSNNNNNNNHDDDDGGGIGGEDDDDDNDDDSLPIFKGKSYMKLSKLILNWRVLKIK